MMRRCAGSEQAHDGTTARLRDCTAPHVSHLATFPSWNPSLILVTESLMA